MKTSETRSDAAPTAGGVRALIAYWAPPVVIGLLVGLAAVGIYKYGGIGRSDVDEIVEHWEWGLDDQNAKLADQITALGASARSDVIDAFSDAPDRHMDLKVWLATVLTREPFFDTKFLTAQAREGSGAERRAAAVALALYLREGADPAVVMPGILDWLRDLGRDDQKKAIEALAALGPLTSEFEVPAREALIALARKRPAVADDPDEDFVPEVREDAISLGLHPRLRSGDDKEIVQLLHETVVDDDDDFAPRVAAIRALSENRIFTDIEVWKKASQSSDEVVRQAVSENLFRVADPEYGAVLAPMHVDSHPFVRTGSISSQIARRQPTMLPVMDQLLEDHDPFVRFEAMHACAVFRNEPGKEARNGQLLRLLAESDESTDIEGALLALHAITGKAYGVAATDIHQTMQEVESAGLDALVKDPAGRAAAVKAYGEAFGGTAVWTDGDRKATLEKLLTHADPENQERAKRLLR